VSPNGSSPSSPRRAPRSPLVSTRGPWVPKAHPSPLVAEVYVLGRFWIVRKVSESNYALLSPDRALPVTTGPLERVRAEGERMWRNETAQDLEAPGERPTDIVVSDQGSVILVIPRTEAARSWLTDNVDSGAMWYGQSLVVEPRYISYLIEGMMEEGLRISS
jgi:hypothetical protein